MKYCPPATWTNNDKNADLQEVPLLHCYCYCYCYYYYYYDYYYKYRPGGVRRRRLRIIEGLEGTAGA